VSRETKVNLLLGLAIGALVVFIVYNMGVVFIWGDA